MYSQKPDSTNDIRSADDGSLRSPRACPRLIDDNEVEDPGEQPSSGDGVRNGLPTRSAFPRFMQLPPELRHQIWHFYCPDLSVKARVLEFTFQEGEAPSDGSDDYDPDFLIDGWTLASQTKSLRGMLSTHHESRSIALRIYPDELALDMGPRGAIVRFRKESDVVSMNLALDMYIPPDFATQVQNLAIEKVWGYYDEAGGSFFNAEMVELVPMLRDMFPNVKRLYNLWPVKTDPTCSVGHWCVTEYAHKYEYMFKRCDIGTGIEEGRRFLYCWPDLDAHPDYARRKSSKVEKLFHPEQEEEFGLETWSMLSFESDECFRIYDRMRRLYLNTHSVTTGDDEDSPD
ncbi:hypothetical protein E4U56_003329 [Claviceps arundinis]|uniref:2EXR domain-containing protein n=1 Tax=Claviceps arundinis TaxID=1623583 RepID=A0A9P7MZV5_9HYPO|nr:hypothetical protein E4U56_003329 [Claviceps arundinis]